MIIPFNGVYEHMVYSDGLAAVSVYVEEQGAEVPVKTGKSQLGTNNAYTRKQGAIQITVIGEVPAVETFDISEKMRGQTAGKAMWNTHFKEWTQVPKSIAATLTEDIRKRKGLSPNPPEPSEFIDRD